MATHIFWTVLKEFSIPIAAVREEDFEEWQQSEREKKEREEALSQEKKEKESEEFRESFVRLFTTQSK